jgi:hypothetical protein
MWALPGCGLLEIVQVPPPSAITADVITILQHISQRQAFRFPKGCFAVACPMIWAGERPSFQ